MDSRSRAVVAALVVVLAGALLLAVADLSVATSEAATGTTVAVSSTNDATADLDGELLLYVHGDAPEELVTGLVAAFEERGVTVERIDELQPHHDTPVAALAVDDWQLGWRAVTADADVTWRLVYSPGNTTSFGTLLAGDTGTVLTDENPYVLEGTFRTTDRTTGVVSWPAYRRGVAERSADAALEALWAQLGA